MRHTSTPWGSADHVSIIAPGIIEYKTPSHGGIGLSLARQMELASCFTFPTFAGGPWYEEDEDVAAVMVAFPEYFDGRACYYAVRTVKAERNSRWVSAATWLECNHPKALLAMQKHDAYAAEVAGKWEVGYRATSPEWAGDRAWSVGLSRGSDRRDVVFAEYPTQSHYSDDELAAVTVTKPVLAAAGFSFESM